MAAAMLWSHTLSLRLPESQSWAVCPRHPATFQCVQLARPVTWSQSGRKEERGPRRAGGRGSGGARAETSLPLRFTDGAAGPINQRRVSVRVHLKTVLHVTYGI